MTDELATAKALLRRQSLAARAAAVSAGAGEALARHLLSTVPLPAGAAVSAFWPMGEEIDVRPLLHRLHALRHPLGLPVVVKRGNPLTFRAWEPGDRLVPGGFGTSVPAADRPEVVPQVLLVPLLAWDRAGYRLGYGGGFYDRTLAKLRPLGPVLAVGVAYAGQEVPAVPRDHLDARLDWLVTEREAIAFA